jgi:cell division protein FtsB
MIRFTAEINPTGATAERRLESLVTQLRAQNEQLQAIIADLYKQIEKKEK